MSKAILLSRVSTGLQDLEQQTETLVKYAKTIGYNDKDLIIIEDTESAVKLSEEERNGLNKLKKYVLYSQVADVIVYELSRIARTPKVLYGIRDFLIEHHIQLHVINPHFKLLKQDGSIDESANVIFSIFCSMAENEGYLRKQRFARGKRKLIEQNLFPGGRTPFGYTVNQNKEYIIKEEERDIIVRIFKMYEKMTISDIAKELIADGTFDKNLNAAQSMVRTVLHREFYTGAETHCDGYRNSQKTYRLPQIISKETYDAAQEKLKERKKYNKTKSKYTYLCRGLVTDINGILLQPMHCHGCYARWHIDKTHWDTLSIRLELLDAIAWHFTKLALEKAPKNLNVLKNEANTELLKIASKLKKNREEVEKLHKKMLAVERRLLDEKISEAMANELQSEIQNKIDAIDRDNQTLEDRRKDLKKYLNNLLDTSKSHLLGNLDKLPVENKKRLVKEQIMRIVVIKGKKRCEYVLGIQYFSGDYVMVDVNTISKKVKDEDGNAVEYEKTS